MSREDRLRLLYREAQDVCGWLFPVAWRLIHIGGFHREGETGLRQ